MKRLIGALLIGLIFIAGCGSTDDNSNDNSSKIHKSKPSKNAEQRGTIMACTDASTYVRAGMPYEDRADLYEYYNSSGSPQVNPLVGGLIDAITKYYDKNQDELRRDVRVLFKVCRDQFGYQPAGGFPELPPKQ
jgi:hypothetical protein